MTGRDSTAMENATSPVLPDRPYLTPWYRLGRDHDSLIFQYAHAVVVFEGKAVQHFLPVLLPLLDGTRTLAEIDATLGEAVAPATRKALSLLHEHGLLIDGPPLAAETPAMLQQTLFFLTAQEPSRSVVDVQTALQEATVACIGSSPIAPDVARLLSRCGMHGVEPLTWQTQREALIGFDLVLTIPSGNELGRLPSWNRLALDAGRPWLQILPFDGKSATIGPLYVPKETCCYECFQLRRVANHDHPYNLSGPENAASLYPSAPPLDSMVAGLAALIALRWMLDRDPFLPGRFYALELGLNIHLSLHHVYRVPRCMVCTDVPHLGSPLPWHEAATE